MVLPKGTLDLAEIANFLPQHHIFQIAIII